MGLSVGSLGIFLDSWVADFQSTPTRANLAVAGMLASMSLAAPFLGPLLDRYSIRVIMVLGALLQAASLALISQATSIGQVSALLMFGVGVSIAMFGPLAAGAVIAKWFNCNRGLALGIGMCGPPTGSVLISPLTGSLVEALPWREAMLWLALIPVAIAPLLAWLIRSTPGEIGQSPDGLEPAAEPTAEAAPSSTQRTWSVRELVADPTFWAAAISIGLAFSVSMAWMLNVAPFAVDDRGIAPSQVGLALALQGAFAITGTFIAGWLSDRLSHKRLLLGSMLLQVAATLVFYSQSGLASVFVGMSLLGLAMGGLLPLMAALVGHVYGATSFGQAFGLLQLVGLPFMLIAPPLVGYMRAGSGSFDSALLMLTGATAVAIAILMLLPTVSAAAEAPEG